MGMTVAALLLFIAVIPLKSPLFPEDYSTIVTDNKGKLLRAFLNHQEQWYFPPDKEAKVPDKLKTAAIYFEDRFFYNHMGINLFAIFRAFYWNLTSLEVKSGASTITMQLARMLNRNTRTPFNKSVEILQALKIELIYSKEEILSFYFSHAPYGGNIIGYQAASLLYFGKEPDELTWSEAAILAVLPNAPSAISPVIDQTGLSEKKNWLLEKLFQQHIINKETLKIALEEPVPLKLHKPPNNAPHLTRYIKEHIAPLGGRITTTIDWDIQRDAAYILSNQMDYLDNLGIENGAVLVAETQSGKIRAYVGSQDFFDFASQGQVDGIIAPRSTGSILKPFLYALSMDAGILLPSTKIKDVPSHFGAFSPTNASLSYDGLVTARDALVRSLNVPAVLLLKEYGLFPFYLFLKKAGLSTLFRTSDDYGLPLIIGGAEATLFDMVSLYRGLGCYGNFSSISFMEEQKTNKSEDRKLISPGASYLTLDILKELARPGEDFFWEQYQDSRPIAWKTGTSYGQRDAWAIGVSPQWTIGVWTGNFDGRGNPNLSGSKSSAPILFGVFNALGKNPDLTWFKKPQKELRSIELCADTGYQANSLCPDTVLAEAPRNMAVLKTCPYHRKLFIDNDSGAQVCSLCWEPGHYHSEVPLIYPPDIVQYLRSRGHLISTIPLHKESCPIMGHLNPLEILYPQNNAKLWIPRDLDQQLEKITLKAAHQNKEAMVYWYMDKIYLGATENNHVFPVTLSKGWHELEVIDQMGASKKTAFYTDLNTE